MPMQKMHGGVKYSDSVDGPHLKKKKMYKYDFSIIFLLYKN